MSRAARFLLIASAAWTSATAPVLAHPRDHAASAPAKGLVLQETDGERRIHRPPPSALSNLAAPFVMKVDKLNGGATDMVMFTEDIAPGQAIPPHRHLDTEEIIFIHAGTGVASMNGRDTAVGPGSTIYMPRNTGVRLRNTGADSLRIVAIFSRPSYDQYMRDISAPEGQVAAPLTVEELNSIRARHKAHVAYDRP
jgi:quercetin dioxygenase-like cupin family protein